MVDQAFAGLARRRVNNEEKLKSLQRVAGFSWNRNMRSVGSRKLPVITQRSAINQRAKELARALKMRFRRLWFAPPELAIENPRKWWNLVATAGLSGRASGEAWNRLFTELGFDRSGRAEC